MTAVEASPVPRVVRVDVLTAPPSVTSRCQRSRARAAVIAAVLAFVGVQFALSRAVESDAIPVRDPIYLEKLGLLERHPAFFAPHAGRPRVLALGSSRTLLSVDANALGTRLNAEAFNLGCHGCGPITGALYFRRLLAAGGRAETVLIELHPAMLADHDPPMEHRWLHEYRLKGDEPDVLRGFGWCITPPAQHRPGGWLSTAHTYRFAALDRYAPEMLTCPFGMTLAGRTDAFGFVRGTDVPPTDRPALLVREYVLYLPAFDNFKPGGAAVAAVRDTVRQCREHGITPVLLLSAESTEFRRFYGSADVSGWAARFARGCGARLIDAREWLPDSCFVDGHHLTGTGAEAFTARLAEELRR